MISPPTCKSLWGILLVQHSEESDDELDSEGEDPAHPGAQLDAAPRAHVQPEAPPHPSFASPTAPEDGSSTSEGSSVDTSASVAVAIPQLSLTEDEHLQPLAAHVDAVISPKHSTPTSSGGSNGTAFSQPSTYVSQEHVASTMKQFVLQSRTPLSNGAHDDPVN